MGSKKERRGLVPCTLEPRKLCQGRGWGGRGSGVLPVLAEPKRAAWCCSASPEHVVRGAGWAPSSAANVHLGKLLAGVGWHQEVGWMGRHSFLSQLPGEVFLSFLVSEVSALPRSSPK